MRDVHTLLVFTLLLAPLSTAYAEGATASPSQSQSAVAGSEEVVAAKQKLPSEAQMRDALQAYIDRFNAKDGTGLASLFADDGRIEDPVGGGKVVQGRAAIDAFYRGAVEVVDRLELAAPIRTSYGNAAAMAFDIHMQSEGRPLLIRAIDVMTFNADGKIIDMKAYHGPGNAERAEESSAD